MYSKEMESAQSETSSVPKEMDKSTKTESISNEHIRNRLLKRLELADTSERVIGNNLFALNAISEGALVIEKPEDSQIDSTPLKSANNEIVVILDENNGSIIIGAPLRKGNGEIIDHVWLKQKREITPELKKDLSEGMDDLLGTLDYTLPLPEYNMETKEAVLDREESRRLGLPENPVPTYAELFGLDLNRLNTKEVIEEFVKNADSQTLRNLYKILLGDHEMSQVNGEVLLAILEGKERFRSNYSPVYLHLTNNEKINELISSRELSKQTYKKGFEHHLFETIRNNDSANASLILDRYWYGNSEAGSLAFFGDYPIHQQTKSRDVLFGFEDNVFLGVDTWLRNYPGQRMSVVKFDKNDLAESNPLVVLISMDIAGVLYKNDASDQGYSIDPRFLDKFTSLLAENLIGLNDFETYYKRYCESVFDSEESMINFLENYCVDFVGGFEGVFGLNYMTDSEKNRALELWNDYGLPPPFNAELMVKK
ncbi:MAG: hypothetical protein J5I47_06415, partial [Vicingus serpentipes]|nr:hypothetical protein [Vicingus serpentipes]